MYVLLLLYIETPRPNTNKHVYAHKYLHCAGMEPVTCVVGEYSHHYATSAVRVYWLIVKVTIVGRLTDLNTDATLLKVMADFYIKGTGR
jgi:hypothetical protein